MLLLLFRLRDALIMFAVALLCGSSAHGLTDEQLLAVRDGFEERRDQALGLQIEDPYPPMRERDGDSSVNLIPWHYIDFALAALHQNQRPAEANEALRNYCRHFANDPETMLSNKGLYWSGNLLIRVHEMFHEDSEYFPGRLEPETCEAIRSLMWDWARVRSKISEAEIEHSGTWYYIGSENHHAMRTSTAWGIAQILKDRSPYNTYRLDDGHTLTEHYDAWTAYFRKYLRQRALKGLVTEIASPGYAKYTLQGWYNFFDLAEDPTLRLRGGRMLDLYWAVWAEEQIDCVRGGGKARAYQPLRRAANDSLYGAAWYYFGKGQPLNRPPGLMVMLTSDYRPPLVVMDLALDTPGRGSYESIQRRMGLRREHPADQHDRWFRTDYGGILRYTWCTPDFVMGTLMTEARPLDDWIAGSAQNRWHGVIFQGHPDARIYPQCEGLGNGKTYNQQWSVQKRGAVIVQKLPPKRSGVQFSRQAGDMRVWFSDAGLTGRVEEDGWVFAEAAGAWAAVRVVSGGYTWDEPARGEVGRWLRCEEDLSPVVMEVAGKGDYADYAAFRKAVIAQPLQLDGNELTYESLAGDVLTLHTDYSLPPEIDGEPVDYVPPMALESPFVQAKWNDGRVTLAKGDRRLMLDFNQVAGGGESR